MADDGAFGNIIINPIHIGISMMNNIVFLLPEKSACTHSVHTQTKQIIEPGFSAVAAMVGIMHYTKTNAG